MSKLTTFGVAVAASFALAVPVASLAAPANAASAGVHAKTSVRPAAKVHRAAVQKTTGKSTTSKVHRTTVKRVGKEFAGKEFAGKEFAGKEFAGKEFAGKELSRHAGRE